MTTIGRVYNTIEKSSTSRVRSSTNALGVQGPPVKDRRGVKRRGVYNAQWDAYVVRFDRRTGSSTAV